MEFVCSMWNLLTLSEDDLGILAYLMKDPSGVMRIRCKSVVCRLVWRLFICEQNIDIT
jgi:hypothetical protein